MNTIKYPRNPWNQELAQKERPRVEQHEAAQPPEGIDKPEPSLDAAPAKSLLTQKELATDLPQDQEVQVVADRVGNARPALQQPTVPQQLDSPAANSSRRKKKQLPVFWSSDNQAFT